MIHMQSRSVATIKTNARHSTGQYSYAVTISKHQKKDYVDKSEIENVLSILIRNNDGKKLSFGPVVYENSGQYSQLHLHGVCTSVTSIYFKENCSIDGFRIQWKRIHSRVDYDKWIDYITKEVRNQFDQNDVLICNFYNYNYAF